MRWLVAALALVLAGPVHAQNWNQVENIRSAVQDMFKTYKDAGALGVQHKAVSCYDEAGSDQKKIQFCLGFDVAAFKFMTRVAALNKWPVEDAFFFDSYSQRLSAGMAQFGIAPSMRGAAFEYLNQRSEVELSAARK